MIHSLVSKPLMVSDTITCGTALTSDALAIYSKTPTTNSYFVGNCVESINSEEEFTQIMEPAVRGVVLVLAGGAILQLMQELMKYISKNYCMLCDLKNPTPLI